jgi:hypothetical protein
MLKLFTGHAASSTRALSVAAAAWLLSAGAHAAAQGDAAPLPAPFERYQTWAEAPVADWRAANARVGEIGGWRTYAREAAEADAEVDDAMPTQHGTPHGDRDE